MKRLLVLAVALILASPALAQEVITAWAASGTDGAKEYTVLPNNTVTITIGAATGSPDGTVTVQLVDPLGLRSAAVVTYATPTTAKVYMGPASYRVLVSLTGNSTGTLNVTLVMAKSATVPVGWSEVVAGGGSGDVTAVNVTASAPLTGTASCASGPCAFTLGLAPPVALYAASASTPLTLRAYSSGTDAILTWLSSASAVLGSIAHGGGVIAPSVQLTTGVRPTCDATARGTVWYVAGGVDVADTFEVCRKDGSNVYAWVSVY